MYTYSRVEAAQVWLLQYLTVNGPTDSRTVKHAAAADGIMDEFLLNRARKRAKVWSVKTHANATVWQIHRP